MYHGWFKGVPWFIQVFPSFSHHIDEHSKNGQRESPGKVAGLSKFLISILTFFLISTDISFLLISRKTLLKMWEITATRCIGSKFLRATFLPRAIIRGQFSQERECCRMSIAPILSCCVFRLRCYEKTFFTQTTEFATFVWRITQTFM